MCVCVCVHIQSLTEMYQQSIKKEAMNLEESKEVYYDRVWKGK